MLYSDYLNHPKVIESMKKVGLDNVASPYNDFSLPGDTIHNEVIQRVIDNETLARREAVENAKKEEEYKRKYAKEIKLDEKAKAIRSHIEGIVKNNLATPFDQYENACITVASEYCAANFEFEPGEKESKTEDYSGLNELQKLLKKSSITRLSQKMSMEEIARRGVIDSQISKFMK